MKTLAQRHPVLFFLLINFIWTWSFWFAALPFRGQTLQVLSLVVIGGFGPAIAGILTLGGLNGFRLRPSRSQIMTFVLGSLLIFGMFALRYAAGNLENFNHLADDLSLTWPILVGIIAASLIGGWVFSSAFSQRDAVRRRMGSMLPWRLPRGWSLLAVCFYAGMILLAWALAALLGMGVEYPGLWGQPVLEVLPLYALTFGLTLLALGGNEEAGWRGFLQPALQQRFSPLVAALIVSLFWSLWHLPLFLNGFYQGDVLAGMLGGGVYRVLLSIFMAWFYNRSGGNLFLMIFLHASFNNMPNYLPTADGMLAVLWLVVVVVIVFRDKLWRKLPAAEQNEKEAN
jgi:membrane protease YdiL (CAAX protease family)